MKVGALFVLLLLTVGFMGQDNFGQVDQRIPNASRRKGENLKSQSCKDGTRVELPDFTFCAPNDLVRLDVNCIHWGCASFEAKSFVVTVDRDSSARPVAERDYPTYEEKISETDRAHVWMWSYEPAGRFEHSFKYLAGMRVTLKDKKKKSFTLSVASKTTPIKDIAERIFATVEIR